MCPIANANSKSSSSTHSSLPTHSTITNIIDISSKRPTYFPSSFSTHEEINCQSYHYLLNREVLFKEGFNTSLQHAFFN